MTYIEAALRSVVYAQKGIFAHPDRGEFQWTHSQGRLDRTGIEAAITRLMAIGNLNYGARLCDHFRQRNSAITPCHIASSDGRAVFALPELARQLREVRRRHDDAWTGGAQASIADGEDKRVHKILESLAKKPTPPIDLSGLNAAQALLIIDAMVRHLGLVPTQPAGSCGLILSDGDSSVFISLDCFGQRITPKKVAEVRKKAQDIGALAAGVLIKICQIENLPLHALPRFVLGDLPWMTYGTDLPVLDRLLGKLVEERAKSDDWRFRDQAGITVDFGIQKKMPHHLSPCTDKARVFQRRVVRHHASIARREILEGRCFMFAFFWTTPKIEVFVVTGMLELCALCYGDGSSFEALGGCVLFASAIPR